MGCDLSSVQELLSQRMDYEILGCGLHCSLASHNMKSGLTLQCDPCIHHCFLSAFNWEIDSPLEHPSRKRENRKTVKRPAGQPPCQKTRKRENEKMRKREPVESYIQKTRKRENEKMRISFSRFLVFWRGG